MRLPRNRLAATLSALAAICLFSLALSPSIAASYRTGASGAQAVHPGAVYSLTVTATGTYGYQPDTISNVPLSTSISVTFIDATPLAHTFNVSSREGVEIVDYASTNATQLTQILFSKPALYNATVSGHGDESVGTFRSPATPGWYEFVCNVTGHFQQGMFGYIAFGEAVPSNLTLPGGPALGGLPGFTLLDGTVVFVVALVALVCVYLRLRSVARERALEEADRQTSVLPPSPPPPGT